MRPRETSFSLEERFSELFSHENPANDKRGVRERLEKVFNIEEWLFAEKGIQIHRHMCRFWEQLE